MGIDLTAGFSGPRDSSLTQTVPPPMADGLPFVSGARFRGKACLTPQNEERENKQVSQGPRPGLLSRNVRRMGTVTPPAELSPRWMERIVETGFLTIA